MAKPFDATTEQLVETRPDDWRRFLGLRGTGTQILQSEVSTITAETDQVLLVQDANPYLLHIEFQVSSKPNMPERLLRYNSLLRYQHQLPVLHGRIATLPLAMVASALRRIVCGWKPHPPRRDYGRVEYLPSDPRER
ncbi:MAG: hypothetical protein H7Z41_17360 [Cytophagales bacterium]|nr:hypothetical protein [Armatimonadota bacterium]